MKCHREQYCNRTEHKKFLVPSCGGNTFKIWKKVSEKKYLEEYIFPPLDYS